VYAVIKTGGKQERVEEGQRLAVELLPASSGEEVSFSPLLVVDGATILATPGELEGASVSARVLGEEKGPKVRGFVYKSKTRSRRKWGHRQRYSTIEVTGITVGARATGRGTAAASKPAKGAAAAEAPAPETAGEA
jgi:large subunit ribosomal protein L21